MSSNRKRAPISHAAKLRKAERNVRRDRAGKLLRERMEKSGIVLSGNMTDALKYRNNANDVDRFLKGR